MPLTPDEWKKIEKALNLMKGNIMSEVDRNGMSVSAIYVRNSDVLEFLELFVSPISVRHDPPNLR